MYAKNYGLILNNILFEPIFVEIFKNKKTKSTQKNKRNIEIQNFLQVSALGLQIWVSQNLVFPVLILNSKSARLHTY